MSFRARHPCISTIITRRSYDSLLSSFFHSPCARVPSPPAEIADDLSSMVHQLHHNGPTTVQPHGNLSVGKRWKTAREHPLVRGSWCPIRAMFKLIDTLRILKPSTQPTRNRDYPHPIKETGSELRTTVIGSKYVAKGRTANPNTWYVVAVWLMRCVTQLSVSAGGIIPGDGPCRRAADPASTSCRTNLPGMS